MCIWCKTIHWILLQCFEVPFTSWITLEVCGLDNPALWTIFCCLQLQGKTGTKSTPKPLMPCATHVKPQCSNSKRDELCFQKDTSPIRLVWVITNSSFNPTALWFNTLDCTLVCCTSTYQFKVLLKLVDYILMASATCDDHTLREPARTFVLGSAVELHCTTPNKMNYIDIVDLVCLCFINPSDLFYLHLIVLILKIHTLTLYTHHELWILLRFAICVV